MTLMCWTKLDMPPLYADGPARVVGRATRARYVTRPRAGRGPRAAGRPGGRPGVPCVVYSAIPPETI